MRAFLALLVTGLVALAAGAAGFQAGVLSSLGTSGTGVVYVTGAPHFGGLVFFVLFAAFILFAIGGRRRRWAGHGPMSGRGPWSGGFGPMGSYGPMGGHGPMGDGDPRRQWVAEAHRRLHEEEAAQRASSTAGPGGTARGGTNSDETMPGGPTPVA
jgi:hypothetical protein